MKNIYVHVISPFLQAKFYIWFRCWFEIDTIVQGFVFQIYIGIEYIHRLDFIFDLDVPLEIDTVL